MSEVNNQPKPDWSPVPRPGCKNVEVRVLLNSDGILIANLRFGSDATIDEHSAPYDIDVICVEGSGFTSVDGEASAIRQGQTVRWPRDKQHQLWTESTTMETIMVERYDG